MLLRYPDPDWTAGVWIYGDETAEDSDSDAEPCCGMCDGALDDDRFCRSCMEYQHD